MKNLYRQSEFLDHRACKKFHLTQELLMENAASALADFALAKACKNTKILIICGSGNNGADGIGCARILQNNHKNAKISLMLPFGVRSSLAKIQLKRARALHVKLTKKIKKADIIIDCLFGSGLSRPFDRATCRLIKKINSQKALKIACDFPSGLTKNGQILSTCIKADHTIAMGALKIGLFSDFAKEQIGTLSVANLGVSRADFETPSKIKLLEKSDFAAPNRSHQNTHKGSYGHAHIVANKNISAARLSAIACFNYGAGKVSLVAKTKPNEPYILHCDQLTKKSDALAIGMGLGRLTKSYKKFLLTSEMPLLLDADILHDKIIKKLLKSKENIVLTPHPKEFLSVLEICKIAHIDIKELQKNRIKYAQIFAKKYPKSVLLLKGANQIIAHKNKIYINAFGSNALAKGGSGDVLAGIITSLLAQKYTTLQACIQGSLALTLANKQTTCNNYAQSPLDLCEALKHLPNKATK